jgi:hypothetical protein
MGRKMRTAIRLVTAVILLVCTAARIGAQTPADTWRAVAEDVGLGSEVNVRLSDGRRVRATLVGVRDDAVLLQPRTRVPVPVQPVSYYEIVSLERRGKGIGTGKAVAIGVATGVGALFGMMAIMVALIGD